MKYVSESYEKAIEDDDIFNEQIRNVPTLRPDAENMYDGSDITNEENR